MLFFYFFCIVSLYVGYREVYYVHISSRIFSKAATVNGAGRHLFLFNHVTQYAPKLYSYIHVTSTLERYSYDATSRGYAVAKKGYANATKSTCLNSIWRDLAIPTNPLRCDAFYNQSKHTNKFIFMFTKA